MNPALPIQHFVPDCEARLMPDGRMYVYGSYDIAGNHAYCSNVLHVFSSSDLIFWTDHGVSFQTSDIPWANEKSVLYAPDCIYKDGKYYLYFCMSDNTEGVAVSDSPSGPFMDPKPIPYASGDGIDPAVFIDDDGQAYYYWGQFTLRGAKLKSDMRTLDEATIQTNLADEKRHGFHEGASVRKRNGIYYLIYTSIIRGKATCLAYAAAVHPLGPFEYKGIVIDNIGTDPGTWNNHGSIEPFGDDWYVFYHKSSSNSCFMRRLCIEKIEFLPDGTIKEAVPTTQGVLPPIGANTRLPAFRACRLGGWGSTAYIGSDPFIFEKEGIININNRGWAAFRYLDFSEPVTKMALTYASSEHGEIQVWADDIKLGSLSARSRTGTASKEIIPVRKINGIHTLYLEWDFPSGANAQIHSFEFLSST